MLILGCSSMGTKFPYPCIQGLVISHNHAAIAGAAKVLCRIKTKAPELAHRSSPSPAISGADGLGRVFHDWEIVALSNFQQRIHVGTLAIHVYGEDCTRALIDRSFHQCRINVVGSWINIDESRSSAQTRDRAAGGKESERCGDYLVTRLYVESHQG